MTKNTRLAKTQCLSRCVSLGQPTSSKMSLHSTVKGWGCPNSRFEAHAGYDGVMLRLPGKAVHLEFTGHETGSSGTGFISALRAGRDRVQPRCAPRALVRGLRTASPSTRCPTPCRRELSHADILPRFLPHAKSVTDGCEGMRWDAISPKGPETLGFFGSLGM